MNHIDSINNSKFSRIDGIREKPPVFPDINKKQRVSDQEYRVEDDVVLKEEVIFNIVGILNNITGIQSESVLHLIEKSVNRMSSEDIDKLNIIIDAYKNSISKMEETARKYVAYSFFEQLQSTSISACAH